ncbi:MAG: MarC family protein [Myxococcota bacterium]|jgi:multiple antibiotic resistance protein|nr:MarC family protein [Myxococcota bacterium]
MDAFVTQLIFLIIIINPVSQMMLIVAMAAEHPNRSVIRLLYSGNLWAFLITGALALAGTFIFEKLFRVDLDTLRLAGGVILAAIGYQRITRGAAFTFEQGQDLQDVQVVPFAVPMIVGPAAFSHAITTAAHHGALLALAVVATAIIANIVLMRATLSLRRFMNKAVVGVSVRLSGLVTLTIGLDMGYRAIVQLVRHANQVA